MICFSVEPIIGGLLLSFRDSNVFHIWVYFPFNNSFEIEILTRTFPS